MEITPELTVKTVLQLSKKARAVLVRHFGAGVGAPGQTWTNEPLKKAALIRGVSLSKLLRDLRGAVKG